MIQKLINLIENSVLAEDEKKHWKKVIPTLTESQQIQLTKIFEKNIELFVKTLNNQLTNDNEGHLASALNDFIRSEKINLRKTAEADSLKNSKQKAEDIINNI